MKKFTLISFPLLISLIFYGCSSSQISKTIGDILKEGSLSTEEVAMGLKQALEKGTVKGAQSASRTDGYFKNPKIRIPLPPEMLKVESKLRQIGLGNQVDRFVLNLNRAAEQAADEAKPIFIDAIKAMTIQDAWNILKGEQDAATQYLRRTTYNQLYDKFNPIVERTLEKVNVTRYYNDVANIYNRVPGVNKINDDLEQFATQKAIDGLFTLIAEEEANIRENPAARTTELLKKVFAQAD
ncbi:MAG: DUF4197 domain-containing protein [Candidatus Cyclobacteriaceae bacterium M3_2C_046]